MNPKNIVKRIAAIEVLSSKHATILSREIISYTYDIKSGSPIQRMLSRSTKMKEPFEITLVIQGTIAPGGGDGWSEPKYRPFVDDIDILGGVVRGYQVSEDVDDEATDLHVYRHQAKPVFDWIYTHDKGTYEKIQDLLVEKSER